jgi:hypothetical protein
MLHFIILHGVECWSNSWHGVSVSLPGVWVQEIKRMTVAYFTHGLFITCTQKSRYIYKSFIAIFTRCSAFPPNPTPCIIDKTTQLYLLGEQLLCSWWRIPIEPCLWSSNNCPTPLLLPLSPFHTLQFKLHYLHRRHQQFRSSSSGTVSICPISPCTEQTPPPDLWRRVNLCARFMAESGSKRWGSGTQIFFFSRHSFINWFLAVLHDAWQAITQIFDIL